MWEGSGYHSERHQKAVKGPHGQTQPRLTQITGKSFAKGCASEAKLGQEEHTEFVGAPGNGTGKECRRKLTWDVTTSAAVVLGNNQRIL